MSTDYQLRAAELGSDHLGTRVTFKPWPETTITDTLKRIIHGYDNKGSVWVQVEHLVASHITEFNQFGSGGFTIGPEARVHIHEEDES